MNIIIGGDLVPTRSNVQLFTSGSITDLLGNELVSLWLKADFRVFNLEVPLTDIEDPIRKCGPNMIAPTSSVKGIRALDPTLITLANNHIMDQGIDGLHMTMKLLEANDISYVGAGITLDEAKKPYIYHNDKIRIGFYACAEHEFSISSEERPGANPFDPLESLDHIANLKKECDYVIVLYHGGKEHYRYPSPYLQKVCRKMADKGANLVICQHSHCIGCFEEYKGSTLIYGQGNFIFNKHVNEFWTTGLLVAIDVNEDFHIDYIPIIRTDIGIRLANGNEAVEIINAFYKRSNDIVQEGFIEEQYLKFAKKNQLFYLRKLAGFGRLLSSLDVRMLNGFITKHWYSKAQLLAIQNYIECEAHRELLLYSLKTKG